MLATVLEKLLGKLGREPVVLIAAKNRMRLASLSNMESAA